MTEYAIWQNGIVKRLQEGVAFNLSGESFPSNWLTLADSSDKVKRNLYPIVYTNGKDLPDTKDYVEGVPALVSNEVRIAWVASDKSQGDKNAITAAKKQAQVDALEVQQTPTRIREAILGLDNGWLADLNNQIKAIK